MKKNEPFVYTNFPVEDGNIDWCNMAQKRHNQRCSQLLSIIVFCWGILLYDANPWGDSRGMRLLQGQEGAMGGVHSLRSSGAFTEEANQIKRQTTNHRIRDQGPCYSSSVKALQLAGLGL